MINLAKPPVWRSNYSPPPGFGRYRAETTRVLRFCNRTLWRSNGSRAGLAASNCLTYPADPPKRRLSRYLYTLYAQFLPNPMASMRYRVPGGWAITWRAGLAFLSEIHGLRDFVIDRFYEQQRWAFPCIANHLLETAISDKLDDPLEICFRIWP